MLSNLVIGSEKVVLFVDHNSYEPFAKELLQSIARSAPIVCYPKASDIPLIEPNFKANIEQEIHATTEKPNVLLAPVSKLELANTVPDIVNLVHYLKQSAQVKQIFIWCSQKNIQDDKLIPFLRYMSNIVVSFKNETEASILTKRNTGSITRKEYQYSISNDEISVREKVKKSGEKENTTPSIDPESLATFKITLGGSGEQASRDALKLPYERASTESNMQAGHIHYHPDSDDDFDDEDPDEDLNI